MVVELLVETAITFCSVAEEVVDSTGVGTDDSIDGKGSEVVGGGLGVVVVGGSGVVVGGGAIGISEKKGKVKSCIINS